MEESMAGSEREGIPREGVFRQNLKADGGIVVAGLARNGAREREEGARRLQERGENWRGEPGRVGKWAEWTVLVGMGIGVIRFCTEKKET